MGSGASVTIGIPAKAATGFFSSGTAAKKVAAWLTLDSNAGEFKWGSLQQRAGLPAEDGSFAVQDVLNVRNTGVQLELSIKGQTQPTTLEFTTAAERESWARYMEVAIEVLTPESERAARDKAKASQRQQIEDRRLANEERKKKLQEGL